MLVMCVRRASVCLSALAGQLAVVPVAIGSSCQVCSIGGCPRGVCCSKASYIGM